MGAVAGESRVEGRSAARSRRGWLLGSLLAAASAVVLFAAPVASADPGKPDLSFGSRGWVSVSVDPGAQPVLRDMLRLPDGKLLAGGSGGSGAGILARFLADGALDGTFGSHGIARTEHSSWAKLVPQADGKIVAFGSSGKDAAVARLNPDGTLDAGFGEGGIRVLDVRGQFRKTEASLEARGAGADSQGRIVAVVGVGACSLDDEGIDNVKSFGWISDLCGDTAIVRLTSSGDLDPAFGAGDGIRIVTPGGKQIVATLAPDDGILIASVIFEDSGDVDVPNQSFRILRRLGPDGLPDTAFGDSSWVSFEDELEYPMAGLLDAADDGTITATFGSSAIRLMKDGSGDDDFGQAGQLRFETLSRASRLGLSLSFGDGTVTDRHVYLAGIATGRKKSAGRRAVVARLNLDGKLDPTFSNDGLASTWIGEALPEKMLDRRVGLAGGALLVDERGRAIVGVTGGSVADLRFTFGRFQGGEGRRLRCNGVPATVQGTPGDDKLVAGEVTVTGAGDDTVKKGGA
ncbi:MAG: delta-60 repeat domain-containing protein, partial [Actinomycetota bacterium]|nr:delta-60 repeat domain-containing protein [Actinomycetota bacterium]